MTSGKRVKTERQVERDRLAAEREARLRARRKQLQYGAGASLVVVVGVIILVVVLVVTGSSARSSTSTTTLGPLPILKTASVTSLHLVPHGSVGADGPEQVPIPNGATLAPAGVTDNSAISTDGIECQTNEQLVYHIHAHLTVYVNGAPRQIPYGIGILSPQTEQVVKGAYVASGACFSWLHTHAADGIIHIESPTKRTYTLGNFFDLWGEPLSPTQVGPDKGKVTAFYNQQLYVGDPRNIPLNAHAQIQLDVGTLVSPVKITFPSGL